MIDSSPAKTDIFDLIRGGSRLRRDNPGYVPPDALGRIGELTGPLKVRGRYALALREGAAVLDVGCGIGTDAGVLAEAVGPGGCIAGVDLDRAMIEQAQSCVSSRGLEARVRFAQADARALPFRNNVFDACWSERLLQHIPEALLAMREMVRVTKPGGRIAVADADWYSLSIHHPDAALERRFVAAVSAIPLNPSAGRDLVATFRQCGLNDIVVEVVPIIWTDFACFQATSLSFPNLRERLGTSFDAFLDDLDRFGKNDRFFAHADMVLVFAVKPGQTIA